jgi:hypothetical protein
VPLFGVYAGVLGSWLGATSSQDVDGAAVTKDTARAERKRDVNMSLGSKERVGRGVGWGASKYKQAAEVMRLV